MKADFVDGFFVGIIASILLLMLNALVPSIYPSGGGVWFFIAGVFVGNAIILPLLKQLWRLIKCQDTPK